MGNKPELDASFHVLTDQIFSEEGPVNIETTPVALRTSKKHLVGDAEAVFHYTSKTQ